MTDILTDFEITNHKKETVQNPTFGKGEVLIFDIKEGNSISFTIYDANPFLFVQQTFRNKGTNEMRRQ